MLLEVRVILVQADRAKCRSDSCFAGTACQKQDIMQMNHLKMEQRDREGKEEQHIQNQVRYAWWSQSENTF